MRIQEDLKNADIGSIYESVAQGSVPAQIELALRLANGSGMAKDDARAVALLQMAADTANPVAIYYLGVAYANGMGVPKDEGMAIPLWEHAARAGYPDAQYWLGFMIANGRAGIASDWCAAAAFFEAAAEQGVSDAAFMLGSAYHQGKLGQNDELAARWYRKAIDGRINQKAQYNLRLLIEAYRVKWQPGDPGVAPPPAPEDKQLRLREKEPDHVG
jgi:TPR repeat protein